MSDICFGFIEFSVNLENSTVSYPFTRQMVKTAQKKIYAKTCFGSVKPIFLYHRSLPWGSTS